jgi:hypothetical protein
MPESGPKMTTIKSFCTLIVLLFAVNAFGQAQESGEYDRFNDPSRVYFGGFYPSMTSEITINGSVISPPPIGIEDKLGVEDGKFVPWAVQVGTFPGETHLNLSFSSSIETGSLICFRNRSRLAI